MYITMCLYITITILQYILLLSIILSSFYHNLVICKVCSIMKIVIKVSIINEYCDMYHIL